MPSKGRLRIFTADHRTKAGSSIRPPHDTATNTDPVPTDPAAYTLARGIANLADRYPEDPLEFEVNVSPTDPWSKEWITHAIHKPTGQLVELPHPDDTLTSNQALATYEAVPSSWIEITEHYDNLDLRFGNRIEPANGDLLDVSASGKLVMENRHNRYTLEHPNAYDPDILAQDRDCAIYLEVDGKTYLHWYGIANSDPDPGTLHQPRATFNLRGRLHNHYQQNREAETGSFENALALLRSSLPDQSITDQNNSVAAISTPGQIVIPRMRNAHFRQDVAIFADAFITETRDGSTYASTWARLQSTPAVYTLDATSDKIEPTKSRIWRDPRLIKNWGYAYGQTVRYGTTQTVIDGQPYSGAFQYTTRSTFGYLFTSPVDVEISAPDEWEFARNWALKDRDIIRTGTVSGGPRFVVRIIAQTSRGCTVRVTPLSEIWLSQPTYTWVTSLTITAQRGTTTPTGGSRLEATDSSSRHGEQELCFPHWYNNSAARGRAQTLLNRRAMPPLRATIAVPLVQPDPDLIRRIAQCGVGCRVNLIRPPLTQHTMIIVTSRLVKPRNELGRIELELIELSRLTSVDLIWDVGQWDVDFWER